MSCSNADCANGWILKTEYPKTYGGKLAVDVATPCRDCRPGYLHPDSRPREESEDSFRRRAAASRRDESDVFFAPSEPAGDRTLDR